MQHRCGWTGSVSALHDGIYPAGTMAGLDTTEYDNVGTDYSCPIVILVRVMIFRCARRQMRLRKICQSKAMDLHFLCGLGKQLLRSENSRN